MPYNSLDLVDVQVHDRISALGVWCNGYELLLLGSLLLSFVYSNSSFPPFCVLFRSLAVPVHFIFFSCMIVSKLGHVSMDD